MSNKISEKDKKDWEEFLSKNEKLPNKDLKSTKTKTLKTKNIDTKHPMITENLMGIKRIKGSYQKAKKPILINDLKLIIDVIDKDKNEKKRAKNREIGRASCRERV